MFKVIPFQVDYISAVKKFTDLNIGQGYYSFEELILNQKKSVCKNGEISSFLLIEKDIVKGLRLSFPANSWSVGKGTVLFSNLWPYDIKQTGYFQSLFLDPAVQGLNWGPKLSEYSIEVLQRNHNKGIATHCWKEAPNNSSYKYLTKMGFKKIKEIPFYWENVDYVCTRDGKPCRCTAIEMYLEI